MKENNLENGQNLKPKIETVEIPNGDSISYCRERGIITSLKIGGGKEVLYMDEDTLNDRKVNIKGGIPVLFPNAGPIPDELKTLEFAELEQHGFARKQEWEAVETMEGINASLRSSKETKKVFPYNFELSLISKFEKDGSFTVTQQVENHEAGKEMPVSFGLHPYFKVPNELKRDVRFNFEGGKYVEENKEKWSNGQSISLENPGTPMEIQIPDLGVLIFKISPEYKKIWVWSLSGKDFVCIEPVMRDKGGIITDPEIVKPHQKYSASLNVSFKKE